MGPYYRDRVPIGIFLAFWVPIGSLFIFQGPYFQCVDYIYMENVNSVCNAESVTFDTFKKASFMVCSTIIKEIYISKFINFKFFSLYEDF